MAEQQKKLFLLDAMALIFRAHFAFIRNPMYNAKGMNTSALFGFTNSLLEILEKEAPTHIGIVFDTSEPTFREETYEAYKANREEQPEDIATAIPMVKQLADAFNIPVLEKPGYEADDIIGTIAKKASKAGFEVYMMTPDKDFAQLVEDNIYLYKPARMGKPSEIWDRETVKEKFGIEEVDQVVDIQGLTGDSIDNIPGIEGIGPKTAEKLIKQFGSVEELINNTDQLKGKQKQKIEDNKENARLSKQLATIYTEVPVSFDEESLKRESPDEERLKDLFRELEFRSISRKIFGEANEEQSGQGDLFQQEEAEKAEKKAASPYKTLENGDHDYQLIQEAKERKALIKTLEESEAFAIDTETSAINPHQAQLVGISISTQPGKGYYLPVNGDPDLAEAIIKDLKPVLANDKVMKIGQNIKYDLLVLKNRGMPMDGPIFDTMIAHYLIEPEQRHNMDYLAETYLQYQPVPIEDLIGKKGKNQGNMGQLKPETIKDYACEDADITYQLYQHFYQMLDDEDYSKLYKEIEGPLIYVLTEMEYEGVKVDQEQLDNFSIELEQEMQSLEATIHEMAGEKFNINSPKQLGDILFEKLNLDPNAKKTQKSQQYSTNEEVLNKLAANHDIAQKVLDYRSVQKLKSTYVDALPELINPNTGRIHTSYQQAVAATGRLSSTNPNLQNIPIRTEKGRRIREAFVPREEGYSILAADYSQIELRLVADISGDESLKEAFKDGQDIHASTAAKIYNIPMDRVTDDMRRSAKTVNFGIIYGISAFGLSQRLTIPRKEASEIIESYFQAFPKVKSYMNEQIEFARKHGYVKTLFGRKRRLQDINSGNSTQRGFAERNAINSPIQGTAADMIKKAMVDVHSAMKAQNFQSKMTMQVHDELIFDARNDELDTLKPLVKEKMQNALKLEVPIEVETGVGHNWLVAH